MESALGPGGGGGQRMGGRKWDQHWGCAMVNLSTEVISSDVYFFFMFVF